MTGTSTGSGRMTDERLEWHLENWASYMKSECGAGKSYPSSSTGLSSGGGYERHFDEMADESETRVAVATDAIIRHLPPIARAAIHTKYLQSRFRYGYCHVGSAFEDAKEAVRAGLMRRGIW